MCNISLDHGFYLKLYQGYITLTILICNSENKSYGKLFTAEYQHPFLN